MGLVYLEFSHDAFYHKFIHSFLCEYTGMITVESLSTFSLFAPSLVNCWRFPDPASYLKKNQVLMSQILKISRGQIPPLLVLHQSPCGLINPEIEVNGRKQEKKVSLRDSQAAWRQKSVSAELGLFGYYCPGKQFDFYSFLSPLKWHSLSPKAERTTSPCDVIIWEWTRWA